MNIIGDIFSRSVADPLVKAGTAYIEQNGLTDRSIEQTKQITEIAAAAWRPKVAVSINKAVIYSLAFTALMVVYCLISLSFGAEWVDFGDDSNLNALWLRWESILGIFFEFAIWFLGGYAALREAGKGRDSFVSKAMRKITEPKVKREAMPEPAEEIKPIPGVKKRRRRLSPKIDAEPMSTALPKAFDKGYEWSSRSIERMDGVHDDIVHLLTVALEEFSEFDIGIAQWGGLRTLDIQRYLNSKGISPAINSRHLHGLALDIVCYDEFGKYTQEWRYYELFYKAVEKASVKTGIPFEWGGNWKSLDGVHFQLPKDQYPDVIDVSFA